MGDYLWVFLLKYLKENWYVCAVKLCHGFFHWVACQFYFNYHIQCSLHAHLKLHFTLLETECRYSNSVASICRTVLSLLCDCVYAFQKIVKCFTVCTCFYWCFSYQNVKFNASSVLNIISQGPVGTAQCSW